MKENDAFPTPIITPSTKASEGHDEDISKEEIINAGLANEEEWSVLKTYALQLFAKGKEIAAKQNFDFWLIQNMSLAKLAMIFI